MQYEFAPLSLWFVGNQLEWPLSTALISRFFLQLRGAIDEDEEVTLPGPTNASGLNHGKVQHSATEAKLLPTQGHTQYNTTQGVVYANDSPLQLQELRRMKTGRTRRVSRV